MKRDAHASPVRKPSRPRRRARRPSPAGARLVRLIESWDSEAPAAGLDKASWRRLKAALDRNRTSDRRLFP